MNAKCVICKGPATKKVIWADGRAYQPSCDKHVRDTQLMLTTKNGKMTELSGVQDLSDTLDMVSSAVYPGLERKPGGPDNWVEAAGGLPSYIERIAKHLHYEQGYSISRAIATAVNTVKRWAAGGTVTEHGTTKRVTPKTQALAQKALIEWEAKKRSSVNLSDADIEPTSTMVALMLPKAVAQKVAVDGGVPVDDMHVTVLFNGDLSDVGYQDLIDKVKEFANEWQGGSLKGTIGGLGTFPADPNSDNGAPWWIPVDVPGLNTLHEQLRGLVDHASEHGYTPHSTLTYVKDGETPPSPVPSTPVEFSSVWVVRGNKQRVEIPLGGETGVDLSVHAILSSMNVKDLAARANAIEDPEARGRARQAVLDLASTIAPRNAKGLATDGRRSYKGQGKWKHGFVPANRAAKEAKAKGSPIAMKRLTRIFGKDTAPDDERKNTREVRAATGRAGQRSAGGRKKDPHSVKVDEKTHPGSESAKDVGFLTRTPFSGDQNKNVTKAGDKNTSLPKRQKEASKSSRIPERARQNWGEIPETLKTVRNGKRYVVAEFGGKQYVTEWIGGVRHVSQTDAKDRKVMRTLNPADAANMSKEELRALVNNPRSSAQVKKVARAALKEAAK